MRGIWIIARRELRSFVDHPTAYVLVIAFLALGLFLAFRSLYAMGVASLRPFFDLLPWLFAVFVPAVTMRTLAEEARSRTLEWLMAQPVRETDVVVGKFLGNWLFVLVALAATLPTAVGIRLASEADVGIMAAQYVGAGLLAAQMVAVGVWSSSATRNQITAFILATAVCLVLVLAGTPVVQIGLPPVMGGVVARLAVVGHFENVARGVIDLRDVLYFLSTAALFLVLATTMLAGHRLSHARGDYRRLRVGAAVIAALVLVVNLLGGHIRGRLDLTRGGLYTLAGGTEEILSSLGDIVHIKLFASAELPPEVQLTLRDVSDLLADFRRASGGNVRVEELDPDRDEAAADDASSFGVVPIEFNVLREDEFQVRRGYFGLAVTYADEQEVIPIIDRTTDLEFRLASAISSMTREEKPGLAFMGGFGARTPFQFAALREGLADRYEIRTVNLEGDSVPEIAPDSVRVLVVAAPNQELDTAAVGRIRRFTEDGGSAFLLLERHEISQQGPFAQPLTTGLEGLLEERGVRLLGDMVFDLSSSERISLGQRGFFSLVRAYPLWPIALRAADHPTTRDLSNVTFGWASPVEITDSTVAMPLWETSEAAGTEPAGSSIDPDALILPESPEELGVQYLAAVVDPGQAPAEDEVGARAGRLVVVGDVSFLEDQFVRANPQNLVFAANAVDWLAQDESLIRIRSKNRTPPALVFTSDFRKNLLKWGSLVGIPVVFAVVGSVRVLGRPGRARRRWQEVNA